MRRINILIGFLLLLALVKPIWAVEELEQEALIKTEHVYSSDIDATASEIELTDTSFEYDLKFNLDNGLPIKVSLDVGHIDINENDPVELPSHLEYRFLGVGAKFPAFFLDNDKFFMGFDAFATFNTDGYAWESSAFRMPFRTYLIYKEDENFHFIVGMWIRPDYDTTVVPIVGFMYKPNDRLTFNLATDNPHISYQLNDKTKAIIEIDVDNQEFEVTRDSDKNVILKYNNISSGIGLEHNLAEDISVSGTVGVVLARRLEYEDSAGKVDPDSGLYTGFNIKARF